MLRGIPANISPDLMKVLMEMGHGDEIVLADANFPAAALAGRLVRCDGHRIGDLLDSILPFFPLDTMVDCPVAVMETTEHEPPPLVWSDYREKLKRTHAEFSDFEQMDRFDFYRRAQSAYAVVATGERTRRANLILKKGVVTEEAVDGGT